MNMRGGMGKPAAFHELPGRVNEECQFSGQEEGGQTDQWRFLGAIFSKLVG
jgi:hypothetical protein